MRRFGNLFRAWLRVRSLSLLNILNAMDCSAAPKWLTSDLLDGDAALGDDPPDEAFCDVEPLGHLGDGEEPAWVSFRLHDPCKPSGTVRGDTCHAGFPGGEPASVYESDAVRRSRGEREWKT